MNNTNLIDANMNNSSVPSVFSNEAFGSVRVIIKENGDPLFCLKDVCDVLGISNPTNVANINLNGNGVYKIKVIDSLGREQEANFVNESSFYKVVLRSNSPKADKFQDWVCNEVLPQIRKTGSYSVQKQLPQTYAEALRELASTVEEKERLELENKAHKAKIEEDAPKVEFADQVNETEDAISIDEFAKIVSKKGFVVGRNQLFSILRSFGLIQKNAAMPIQKYVTQGIFKVKETPNGPFLNRQVLITGKGQLVIFDLLKPMINSSKENIFV